jgi:hypothetical protein
MDLLEMDSYLPLDSVLSIGNRYIELNRSRAVRWKYGILKITPIIGESDVSGKLQWKSCGIDQIYPDPQVARLFSASPIGKVDPLIESGLHQLNLLGDTVPLPDGRNPQTGGKD